MKTCRSLSALLLAGSLVTTTLVSHATERRFVFNYETTTAAKGSFEYEQYVTWGHRGGFDGWTFRHEIEYGISDTLQIGVYAFDWEHNREGGQSSTDWKGSGIELIKSFSDPTKDVLGSALYLESLVSDTTISVEGKLLLQKNFGPFAVVYNAVLEAEWEDGYKEDVGVLEQTVGLSYQITPQFFVGVEAFHGVEFEHWSDSSASLVYVGPNLSVRSSKLWFTVAGLFKATGASDEPDVQVRTIIGYNF
jgi:hypothetical protein